MKKRMKSVLCGALALSMCIPMSMTAMHAEATSRVDEILAGMTIDQKIGQMIMERIDEMFEFDDDDEDDDCGCGCGCHDHDHLSLEFYLSIQACQYVKCTIFCTQIC